MSLALETTQTSRACQLEKNKAFLHVSSFAKDLSTKEKSATAQPNETTKGRKRKREDEVVEKGTSSTDVLKTSLLKFFEEKENIDKFLPIINRTSPISLRLLDYFCVNYSRSTQVVYMIADKYFDVYSSYKNQLKTFSKKRFDPFKRNTRMTYRHENERFETTIGQLCFFKWCVSFGVLDYVEANIAKITEDMKRNSGKPNEEPNGHASERRRRSSRKKSSIQMAATRVPTPKGVTSIVV